MNLSDQRIKKNDASVFPNKLYKEHFPDGIEYHYWNVARFKIINQLIKKIAITIKGISIGCGIGVDVKLLRDYDIEVGHEKRYNLEDIECLAKALGIEVVFNKYIFNILYLFTFIWLMIFKKRPTIIKTPKVHMRKLHNILGSIIALENKLFPSLLYGSSIISILRVNCKK